MTDLLTDATCARKLALDFGVGAIRLVVPDFAAIEAFAGESTATTLALVGTVSSEVRVRTTAATRLAEKR